MSGCVPSTIDHQPSTINHRPSTIAHQPSTIIEAGAVEVLVAGEGGVDGVPEGFGFGGEREGVVLPVAAELADAPEGGGGFAEAFVDELGGAEGVVRVGFHQLGAVA